MTNGENKMAKQELTYKGKKIIIAGEGDDVKMTIDGEEIPVRQNTQTGTAIAIRHLPHASFTSLVDLAKAVVDNVINMRA